MKRIIALLLSLIFIFALVSCGTQNTEEPQSDNNSSANGLTGSTPGNTSTGFEQSENQTLSDKKILTIYFSSANTAGVDAVSSATPMVNNMGSTEYLAEYIHGKVGGDIAKITPVKDYPESYNGTADAAKAERDNDERPEFKPLDVNPEDYDVIFVGYPMWWYTLPMIMYTFFDTYDFSGKTIVPFNTHAGSGDGGTYREIEEFEPGATVLDGLAVSGSRADNSDGDIDEWLEGLNY